MVQVRRNIRFLLNDEKIELSDLSSSDMLLDFLRINRQLTGSKEGCAEGDCGACSVLVGRLHEGDLRYEAVNGCIRFLASLDGCHVVTIEHLSGEDGKLHPVQQAMVDHHASQCGFCTPGIVMALYALWMQTTKPTLDEIETALQGNLCRCTGYDPIVRAAHSAAAAGGVAEDFLIRERLTTIKTLTKWQDGKRVEVSNANDLTLLPADVDDLAAILAERPGATIVAGATDVGLWVTKFLRSVSPMVHVGNLADLKHIIADDNGLSIGAGATYSECQTALAEHYPHLDAFWRRIGGWQVRNMGTVGGNIANGSPIGDTPPVLISLAATVTLRKGDKRRNIALEDYFVAYGKQDLAPGEFVESITIPPIASDSIHGAYKISKRRDEDISSVCAGFNVTVVGGKITAARIAFGGMAATPKRASHAEAALVGQAWSEATLISAGYQMIEDFTPLTDWRASAEYRLQVSRNLFRRFYLENAGGTIARLVPLQVAL